MLILVHLTEYTCSFIINRYLGHWKPFNNKYRGSLLIHQGGGFTTIRLLHYNTSACGGSSNTIYDYFTTFQYFTSDTGSLSTLLIAIKSLLSTQINMCYASKGSSKNDIVTRNMSVGTSKVRMDFITT